MGSCVCATDRGITYTTFVFVWEVKFPPQIFHGLEHFSYNHCICLFSPWVIPMVWGPKYGYISAHHCVALLFSLFSHLPQ